MKKFLIPLVFLGFLCSCDKVEPLAESVAEYDTYDYDPEPDCEVTEKVDLNSSGTTWFTTPAHMETSAVELCGYKYELWSGMPHVKSFVNVSDFRLEEYFRGVENNVDFLVSVATSNSKVVVTATEFIAELSCQRQGYMFTDDLNLQSGGGWCRVFFGGQRSNAKALLSGTTTETFQYNERAEVVQRDFGKIITGLRVVLVPSKTNAPKTIKDPEMDGVTWNLAPSYYGNKDLNWKAGGDDIFLYYTTDYTGREITVVNPYLSSIVSGNDNISYKTNSLYYQLLGSICTWNGYKDTESWKPTVAELKSAVITAAGAQNYYSMNSPSVLYLKDHFDLVQLYDVNMKQTFGDVGDNDRPANLNRNAGGARQFLSYSYITPSDSKWWVNQ